jgi:glutathione S-transferase
MKLYSGPLSMFGAKAEIAVLEKGLDCEREFVPFDLRTLYRPVHPVVLRVNPKRQVPVLIDGDLTIFDSTQIFEYLEDRALEPPLWPRDPRERAQARLLELSSDEIFFPHVITLMPQRSQATGEQKRAARSAIHACYADLERQLESRAEGGEFLAGAYSYADIAFFMAQTFASVLGAPWGAGHPRLDAWRERVAARPAVRSVVGPMLEYLRARSGAPAEGAVAAP